MSLTVDFFDGNNNHTTKEYTRDVKSLLFLYSDCKEHLKGKGFCNINNGNVTHCISDAKLLNL